MFRRVTAPAPEGTVVFLVGMRINHLWAVHRWVPVAIAMPRMLRELMKNRELGMLGSPRTLVSGRLIVVQQYWQSADLLESFAKDPHASHLRAWKDFNRRARGNHSVGIFHETCVLAPGSHENIYVNLPRPVMLGAAVGVTDVTTHNNTARDRLNPKQ